ncbi:hypothetical protein Y032_0171g328 [Ancylostoma ceylanicum]|uniref:Endonuclease/exonuclease/phosphatase domain-containing protein n=1 Tax=Ancylostoma ceylanicum TaxID=53326 RepID=A0A016SVX6_9BILA|nr:hypothetical protein Y032_0171g328 [Ancylostoma ceylanicum]
MAAFSGHEVDSRGTLRCHKDKHQGKSSKRLLTRTTHLTVGTYNCRSICSEAQLSLLMEETERIKFDVISLCETKRRNPLSCTWKNGAGVFLGSRRENSTSGKVGFIVAPRLVQKIRQVSSPSHRIGVLDLQLDKKIKVSVIQIYALTADKDEADHTDFYDEVRETAAKCRSYYKIISGDFNACVGPKRPYEAFIGPHSLEERNEAGERLASFCETSHFYHGNIRFQKADNRRWTYVSPNGVHKHELDHILCNRKVFTDVAVVPKFQTGSDHSFLRAKFHFNNIKAMLDRMANRRPPHTILDVDAAERLAEMHDFEELDSIDKDYHTLVAAITSIKDACRKKKPNHITSRITEETRQLLEKRRNLKRTTHSHLEMTLLNRVCRERVAKDHEAFTRKRLMEAAESRTSIKLTARSIAEYRQVIPCLKDSEGRKVTSRLGTEAATNRVLRTAVSLPHDHSAQ